MRLVIPVEQMAVLRNERGDANAHAFLQSDGERLVVIGGVVLGVPVPLDAEGNPVEDDPETAAPIAFLAFDHDFPADAVQMLASRGVTRPVLGVTDASALEDAAFAAWGPGIAVAVGDVFRYAEVAYEVVQGHTTQAGWEPPFVPALWTPFRDPGDAPQPWVQPEGAHDAYALGARVTHAGQVWESVIDANVWEPGVYGWEPV